jgi:hypothetical protein
MSKHHHGSSDAKKEPLRKMTDDQLRALSDADFWGAIEPEGVCAGCDPRLAAEAVRRNNKSRRQPSMREQRS